jgi:hypothetical protein
VKFSFVRKDLEAKEERRRRLLSEAMRQHMALRHRETSAELAKRVALLGRPDSPSTPEEHELAAKCALLRGEAPLPQSPQRLARAAAHQALLALHAAAKEAKASRRVLPPLSPEAMVWRRLRQLRLRSSGYRQAGTQQRVTSQLPKGPRIGTSHWTRARLAMLLLPQGEP